MAVTCRRTGVASVSKTQGDLGVTWEAMGWQDTFHQCSQGQANLSNWPCWNGRKGLSACGDHASSHGCVSPDREITACLLLLGHSCSLYRAWRSSHMSPTTMEIYFQPPITKWMCGELAYPSLWNRFCPSMLFTIRRFCFANNARVRAFYSC